MSRRRDWTLRALCVDGGALAVGTCISAALFFGSIRPAILASAGIEATRERLEAERETVDRLRRDRRELDRTIAQVRADLAELRIQPEPVSRLNHRLSALTELTAEVGLHVDQLTPGKTTLGAKHSTVAIRLTGRGGYQACAGFLQRLHEDMPDTAVSGLRASANIDAPEQPIEFSFDLLWFAAPNGTMERK